MFVHAGWVCADNRRHFVDDINSQRGGRSIAVEVFQRVVEHFGVVTRIVGVVVRVGIVTVLVHFDLAIRAVHQNEASAGIRAIGGGKRLGRAAEADRFKQVGHVHAQRVVRDHVAAGNRGSVRNAVCICNRYRYVIHDRDREAARSRIAIAVGRCKVQRNRQVVRAQARRMVQLLEQGKGVRRRLLRAAHAARTQYHREHDVAAAIGGRQGLAVRRYAVRDRLAVARQTQSAQPVRRQLDRAGTVREEIHNNIAADRVNTRKRQ